MTIRVSSRLLRVPFRCHYCDGSAIPHYYSLEQRCYSNEHFEVDETIWELPWACERGCSWISRATRIEMSPEFVRIAFRCPVCGGRAIRYYGLEHHGYIDITDRIVPLSYPYNKPRSENYRNYVGAGNAAQRHKLAPPMKR